VHIKSTKRQVSSPLNIGLGVCKKCLKLFSIDIKKIFNLGIESKTELVAIIEAEKEFCPACKKKKKIAKK
jgi:RNA polymerase subunit RPABC4/transcription elongation factor Spt4